MASPAHRLRALHRRRRALIGGILVLPHLRLRPARPTTSGSSPRSCDAAIKAQQGKARCRRSRYLSSSMVFESTPGNGRPTRAQGARGAAARCPPTASRSWPSSTFARGRLGPVPAAVHDRQAVQLRGPSASPARSATRRSMSGNVKLAMSHVVPDLVQKVYKGQDPAAHPGAPASQVAALHLRRRTLARGIRHANGATRRRSTTTSTCPRPQFHDRARGSPRRFWPQGQGSRRRPLARRCRTTRSSTTSSGGVPATEKAQARGSGSRATTSP